MSKSWRKDRPWVAVLLKDIAEAPTLEDARSALARAAEELSGRYPEVARILEEGAVAAWPAPPSPQRAARSGPLRSQHADILEMRNYTTFWT